jgi:hypothetical protein
MRVLKFDRLGADVALRAIGLTSRRMARPKSQGHITIGAIRPLARGAREPGEQLVWHFALGMPGGRALISILSLGIVAPVPEFPRLRRQLPRHDRPGGAVNPGVHVGGAVNAGATVRGVVERGIPGPDLGTWRSQSTGNRSHHKQKTTKPRR